MANPEIAQLEGIAREGRVQILRMLTHAGPVTRVARCP